MDRDTEDFLRAWGMSDYLNEFREHKVDVSALSLLTEDLVKEIIKPIGDRAKFMANLNEWKIILKSVTLPDHEQTDVGIAIIHNLDEAGPSNLNSTNTQQLPPNSESHVGISTSQNIDKGSGTSNSEFENTECEHCEPNSQELPLKLLLSKTNEGKALLLNYQESGLLNNSARNSLCDVIISAELKRDPNISISSRRLLTLATEITQIFKKEHSSTYFIPYIAYGKLKKAAKGKLLNTLHKYRKKYRKLGLITSRSSSSSQEQSASPTRDITSLLASTQDSDPEIENKLLWLQNSSNPFNTVLEYWKETAKDRLKCHLQSDRSILEYMCQYPALKNPSGYILLKEDFRFMYPDHDNSLFEEFPLIKHKIIELGRKKSAHLRDSSLREILQNLDKESNIDFQEEISSYTAFSILPYLFQPHTAKPPVKGKSKAVWRPSRSEIKEGFLLEISALSDLQKTVSDRKDKLLQPTIICVPKEVGNNDYYVVIDNTYYLFKSVCEAVDCCFKCIHALNAKYPPECTALWFFIQKALYKLKTPWDQRFLSVISLFSDLDLLYED